MFSQIVDLVEMVALAAFALGLLFGIACFLKAR
jgi:hypothetical protein